MYFYCDALFLLRFNRCYLSSFVFRARTCIAYRWHRCMYFSCDALALIPFVCLNRCSLLSFLF